MSDVKRLIDEATPLPWVLDPGPEHDPSDWVILGGPAGIQWVTNLDVPTETHYQWSSSGSTLLQSRVAEQGAAADGALIVHAVNALPDYLAVVEVLDRLVWLIDSWDDSVMSRRLSPVLDDARAALARLQETVPA